MKHEDGESVFATLGRGLQNTLPFAGGISRQGVICEEALKALLVMQFSLQRIAATYQSLGVLSEGHPWVRQVT